MFDFFAFLIAIVALIFARRNFNQIAVLRARLDIFERAAQAKPIPVPPPLPAVAPDLAAQPPTMATESPYPRTGHADHGQSGDRTGGRFRWRRCHAASLAAAGRDTQLRRAHRHPLGGLGRRPYAGARRLLHGALFDRGRLDRPRRARAAGRRLRAGAARRRRMDPAQGNPSRHRRAADRQYSRHPHRRRHLGGVRDRLRSLCAVWFPRARHRVHSAGAGGAGHAGRGAAAWSGAGRPRRGRGVRHADPGVVRQTGFLGAVCLSRDRHRGGVRAGADPAVALARRHHHRAGAGVDLSVPANAKPLLVGAACLPCRSPDLSSPRCWWCAASCSDPPPRKAGSSRSRRARSRPICSARRRS